MGGSESTVYLLLRAGILAMRSYRYANKGSLIVTFSEVLGAFGTNCCSQNIIKQSR